MRFFHTHKKGFTLVETLVAVSIIAILGAIVMMNMSEAKKKARDTQRVSDMQQLAVAFRLYKDFNSGNPDYALGDLLGDPAGVDADIATYLAGTIKDPVNSGTTQYYYDSSYNCNGTLKAVIFARTMERTNAGNYVSVCGSIASASDIGIGITPTASTYIMVLQ